MEKTAVGILNSINVNLDSSDVEACHRIGRSKDDKPKKTIIRIVHRKFCKRALLNRKKLSSVDINDNEIQLKNKVFINENLTNYNNKIAFYCRKLKKASLVEKCYSRDWVVHIVTRDGWGIRLQKSFIWVNFWSFFLTSFLVMSLHLCRDKLINKRVIVQFHNKTTIYIVLSSWLVLSGDVSYGRCL